MAMLGCIADDFTGASDAASFLVKGGMSVRLYNGIPASSESKKSDDVQALVIALKSRTEPTEKAVADSLAAAKFLKSQGVQQIYFKYCSTFDSTPEGNIGPVADALIRFTGAPYTLLLPSLPVNGRTVVNGDLYVYGVPLHESHMKNHPLTPMWDCKLMHLMSPQSQYLCRTLPREDFNAFDAAQQENDPFYLVPDYETDEDGRAIAEKFWKLPLLTGGSGILEPLAAMWTREFSSAGEIPSSGVPGKGLLLAGSCSKATLGQIARYQEQGNPCYKLNPKDMLEGRQSIEDAWSFIQEHSSSTSTALVYSSDTPEKVKEFQKLGLEKVASLLENTTAELAKRAVDAGFTRIITAGGETSGAVTKGLGFTSYLMGESVAPGVPIMTPTTQPNLRLVLKSGNFGQEDFFQHALDMTHGSL